MPEPAVGAEGRGMADCAARSDHSNGKWENFPAGLRVLVVDDDSLCLKVIEQMLRSCKYEVTTSITSTGALEALRGRKGDFDLVLSDVFMPDMDGFKLLGMIGLELDIPVIMMSSSGDTDVVLKGVTHGAVDFLIKPVRIEELRNVWQHVIRKRKDMVREVEVEDGRRREEISGGDNSKKRKESGSCKDGKGEDGYATKKPRVNWSVEMHQQFVNAVNRLGADKAVPKKILELMTVKGLTRENVASHLQKYRQTLKRLMDVRRVAGTVCQIPQQASAAPQASGEVAAAAMASMPAGAPAAALLASQLPGTPGFLGSMPQAMGNLLPALAIQGVPALGGGLDAHSVLPSGGMLPALGMGSLQAQVLMSMGLMPQGMQQHDIGAAQEQQMHQHGMIRSASVPATDVADIASIQQLRRNHSAVMSSDRCPQGDVHGPAGPAINSSPVPMFASASGSTMMPCATSLLAGPHVAATLPEEISPHHGQQFQANAATANTTGLLELQVKQEEPGVQPPSPVPGSNSSKVVGANSASGFMADEALLGAIGMDGDLGGFTNEEFSGFAEAAGIPLEESKDTGMDEFLSDFLRDMNAGENAIGH